MKQKYKITSIITAFICFVIIIYLIPTSRHWIYYTLTDLIVPNTISKKSLTNIKTDDYLVLDCRELEEYKTSHLPNAYWLGEDSLFWNRLPKNVTKPILIYCSIGYRSSFVGKQISDSLHIEIYNLEYGIFNYNYLKKPLLDSLENSTTTVHPFSPLWGIFVD